MSIFKDMNIIFLREQNISILCTNIFRIPTESLEIDLRPLRPSVDISRVFYFVSLSQHESENRSHSMTMKCMFNPQLRLRSLQITEKSVVFSIWVMGRLGVAVIFFEWISHASSNSCIRVLVSKLRKLYN